MIHQAFAILVISTVSITASAATYTLSSVPSCIQSSSSVTIAWTASVSANSKDWIGIYPASKCGTTVGSSCQSGSSGWSYVSLSPSPTSGSVSISVSNVGTYNVFYLLNDGYTIGAIGSSFTVASSCPSPTTVTTSNSLPTASTTTSKPSGGFTLIVTGQTIVAGGFFTISWTGAKVGSPDDWITATSSGPPSASNYLSDCWQYVYGDTTKTGAVSTSSGSVSIKAPGTPGTFTYYYCSNNGYSCPASVTVTVQSPKFTCRPKGDAASNIKNVIIILSENHSFDSYFGRYCTAPFGSKPNCNVGPRCCETASVEPGVTPTLLNDSENINFDPDHSTSGEICKMNGGLMNMYTSGCPSSDKRNYAMADGSAGSASQYWGWAANYAMSDRFFQSSPGASCQNDMYFARGAYVFLDNTNYPGSGGAAGPCPSPHSGAACATYTDPTIGDLLQGCGVTFTWYQVGYPNIDVSDDPFLYYPSLANSPNKAN
ncbi:phosphoesterase family-domain-containing protein, partial [Chytriomyces sp. MP71]